MVTASVTLHKISGNWQAEIDGVLQKARGQVLCDFQEASTDEERIHFILSRDLIKNIPWLNFFIQNCKKIHCKSVEKSKCHRDEGNKFFQLKNYEESLQCYSKAVVHAPGAEAKTEDLALAYANTSASLFHLQRYQACLVNITAAKENGYPDRLLHKLLLRQAQCQLYLERVRDAHTSLQATKQHVKSLEDLDQKKAEIFLREVSNFERKLQNAVVNKNNEDSLKEKTKLPDLSYGRNQVVTQATSGLKMEQTGEKGRHLVATQDLGAGDTLIVEKPFAAVLLPDHYDCHCHHCFGQLDMLVIPCDRCTQVRYCSQECRNLSWTSYHNVECPYLDLLHSVGIAHLSVRIVLVAGLQFLLGFKEKLQNLSDQERQSGKVRVGGVSEDGIYGRGYLTVYDLMPHSQHLVLEDLFQYSLTACLLLNILQVSGWFRSNSDGSSACDATLSRNADVVHGTERLSNDAGNVLDKEQLSNGTGDLLDTERYVGGLLLRHIQQLVCNAHAITELQVTQATDLSLVETKSQVRVATAIYPTASLMNHSCDPTIISSFDRDSLVVRTVRDVKKGTEIYNCYGPHHKRMSGPERRQILREQYFFDCQCNACQLDEDQNAMYMVFRCPKCENGFNEEQTDFVCSGCGYHDNSLAYKEKAGLAKDLFLQGIQRLEAHNITGAIDVMRRCHKIRNAILHRYHRDLTETKDFLARCYAIIGDFKKSVRYLKESVSSIQTVYGDSSIEYANELQKYAEVLVSAGHMETALTATNDALPIFKVHYGTSHKSVTELDELRCNLQRNLNLT
ncbi:SET and MYND domain-containing protein 4-like [Pecten maximus]|uniref:SET and MYND domain-containing protein 4-like n=1 Tax=Pecten maximus TaxID=6579 RepID=UPI00145800A9|nr:SET and MYND domain-containing protein 4-like [Pecten maximus]